MAFSYRSRRRRAPLKRRRSVRRRANPFMGKNARRGYSRGALQLANKQAAFLRIGGAIGIETKFYDVYQPEQFAYPPVTDTNRYKLNSTHIHSGSGKRLYTPVQGTGSSNRDGKTINCRAINIRGTIVSQRLSSTDSPPIAADQVWMGEYYIYLALVLDTQTNQLLMNPDDCFSISGNTDADWAVGNLAAAQHLIVPPMLNPYHRKRFRVLASTVVHMPAADFETSGTSGVPGLFPFPRVRTFQLSAKLNGLRVNFSSSSGDVTNTVDNSIHLVCYSSVNPLEPYGGTTAIVSKWMPRVSYLSRFTFTG